MDLFLKIIENQKERNRRNLRIKQIQSIPGINLTEFQLQVLINESKEKIVIYEQQKRGDGTSTALLLKIWQNIFMEENLQDKIVYSSTNTNARILKQGMIDLLKITNKQDFILKQSRFKIELKNNTSIYFHNRNLDAIRGVLPDKEFFVDDYEDENDNNFLHDFRYFFPSKINIFQKGSEEIQWHY